MQQIRTRIIDQIGIIEFYNPPHNFMTSTMVREFDQLTRNWAKDPEIRAIVITGGLENTFITHYDIGDILKMFRPLQMFPAFLQPVTNFSSRLLGRLIRGLDRIQPLGRLFEALVLKTPFFGVVELECVHRTFNRLQRMDKVVIAAINGAASGGATELALACDFRLIADGDWRMGLPEVTAAIIPGAGGTQRLTRLLGVGKALELILEGRLLSPAEALEIGLVNRVIKQDRLLDEALELARKLAKRPPISIRGIKQAVCIGGSLPFMKGLEIERKGFYATGSSQDAALGLQFMLDEFQQGRSDSEILENLATGDVVKFDGR